MNEIHHVKKILLIDDDEATNFLHTLVIESFDPAIAVETCNDGLEGIEQLTRNHNQNIEQPEIVFSDLNMPGMDGWEFLEAFAALPFDTSHIKVIMMLTASVDPNDEVRAKEIACLKEFIRKPLTTKKLKDILDENFVCA